MISNEEFKNIFCPNESFLDNLNYILLSRGFLVEFDGSTVRLSDNAMLKEYNDNNRVIISDKEYLSKILSEANIATIDSDLVIHPLVNDEYSLKTLIDVKMIRAEAGYSIYYEKWNYYKHLKPNKIPVVCLEPFIALVVKALGSVGAETYCSCDGHFEGPALVSFVGGYHNIWGSNVLKCVCNSIHSNLRFENDRFLLNDSSNYSSLYYKKILDVGHFLYQHRSKFLEFKENIISKFKDSREPDKEFFSKYVKEILPEKI